MISPCVGAIALSKPLFSPLPVLKASLQTSQRSVQRCPLVWVPLHYCTAKSTLFPTAGIGGVPANKSKERTPISPRVGAIALLPCQSHSLPHCRCWRRPCKRVKGMYIGIPSCGCHCTDALSKPLFSPLLALDASMQTSQKNVQQSPCVWVPLHSCTVKTTLFPTAGTKGIPENITHKVYLDLPSYGCHCTAKNSPFPTAGIGGAPRSVVSSTHCFCHRCLTFQGKAL